MKHPQGILPPKLPKRPKRESRWRSPAHLAFVRSHGCSMFGKYGGCANENIEAAHVRIGSGAGIGQKPDDWRAVSLCKLHHDAQHMGERSFWTRYELDYGQSVEELIQAFCDASPKAHEIRRAKAERESGG